MHIHVFQDMYIYIYIPRYVMHIELLILGMGMVVLFYCFICDSWLSIYYIYVMMLSTDNLIIIIIMIVYFHAYQHLPLYGKSRHTIFLYFDVVHVSGPDSIGPSQNLQKNHFYFLRVT